MTRNICFWFIASHTLLQSHAEQTFIKEFSYMLLLSILQFKVYDNTRCHIMWALFICLKIFGYFDTLKTWNHIRTIVRTGITSSKIRSFIPPPSLQMVYWWKCKHFEIFLNSPAGTKYRIPINLCQQVLINPPVIFLAETVKQSFCQFFLKTYLKKAYTAYKEAYNV